MTPTRRMLIDAVAAGGMTRAIRLSRVNTMLPH